MSESIEWLRSEIAKRKGDWMGKNFSGQPIMRQQLYTAIMVMPCVAEELLALAELGAQHTPEAVGKRMMEGAAERDPSSGEPKP